MDFLKEIVTIIFSIFNAMSFYLLLGFLFAGILHVLVPQQLFSKYLSKNNWTSVLYATLFGIPLPLCSCGVIPTAMALHKESYSNTANRYRFYNCNIFVVGTSFCNNSPCSGIFYFNFCRACNKRFYFKRRTC